MYIPGKDSILNEVLAACDFPAETLHKPIVNFHNTEDRFAKFEAALAAVVAKYA